VVDDIDQSQYHKCIEKQKQKTLWKREKKTTCDIVVNQCHQPQCHSSVIYPYI